MRGNFLRRRWSTDRKITWLVVLLDAALIGWGVWSPERPVSSPPAQVRTGAERSDPTVTMTLPGPTRSVPASAP